MGKTFTLKLKNATTSKVKWKSSNTSIASVSSKGTVKAKKSGKVTIIEKYLKKNYKCIVTVTNAKDDGEASAEEVSPQYIIIIQRHIMHYMITLIRMESIMLQMWMIRT